MLCTPSASGFKPGKWLAKSMAHRCIERSPGWCVGCSIDGILIGAGIKVGDVDPRWEREYCDTISDEAKAIGGGVVEAIFHSFQRLKNPAT